MKTTTNKGHLGQQQETGNTPRKEVRKNGDIVYHVEDGMTTNIDDLLNAGCTHMVMERGTVWNFGDERGAVKVEDLTPDQTAEIISRYKKLYNITVTFKTKKASQGGRPKVEGHRHMYTVADDVHAWIMENGGGQYITETVRVVMAVGRKAKECAKLANEINGGNNGN